MHRSSILFVLISLAILIYSSKAITLPPNIQAYVPITLQGTPFVPATTGHPTPLQVDSASFQSYEASNLQNVEFFYADGTIIKSWMQDNNSNTATKTNYWFENTGQPGGHSTYTIYMGFAPKTMNLFQQNPGETGEAPQLSPTYGQYDDGSNVFPFYQNFAVTCGASIVPCGWTSINGAGSITNNGLWLNAPVNNQNKYIGAYTVSSAIHSVADASYNYNDWYTLELDTGVNVIYDTANQGGGDYVTLLGYIDSSNKWHGYAGAFWGWGNADSTNKKCDDCKGTGDNNMGSNWADKAITGPGLGYYTTESLWSYMSTAYGDYGSNYAWSSSGGNHGTASESCSPTPCSGVFNPEDADMMYIAAKGTQSGEADFVVYWVRAIVAAWYGYPSYSFGLVETPLAAGPITSPDQPSMVIGNGASIELLAHPSGGTVPYAIKWYSSTSPIPTDDCSNVAGLTLVPGTTDLITVFPSQDTWYCYTVVDSGSPVQSAFSPAAKVTLTYPCLNYCSGMGFWAQDASCASIILLPPSVLGTYTYDCHMTENVITNFQQTPQYTLSSPTALPTIYDDSPAKSVNDYNTQNSISLLACPLDVQSNLNPLDQQYFYTYPFTGKYKNIAGDACDADPTQNILNTKIAMDTQITWNSITPANAVMEPPTFADLGNLWMSMLAYSPMVQYGSQNIISNGYATNSYVFQQIPSLAQRAIWTWNARFADLSSASPDWLKAEAAPSVEKTFTGLAAGGYVNFDVNNPNGITPSGPAHYPLVYWRDFYPMSNSLSFAVTNAVFPEVTGPQSADLYISDFSGNVVSGNDVALYKNRYGELPLAGNHFFLDIDVNNINSPNAPAAGLWYMASIEVAVDTSANKYCDVTGCYSTVYYEYVYYLAPGTTIPTSSGAYAYDLDPSQVLSGSENHLRIDISQGLINHFGSGVYHKAKLLYATGSMVKLKDATGEVAFSNIDLSSTTDISLSNITKNNSATAHVMSFSSPAGSMASPDAKPQPLKSGSSKAEISFAGASNLPVVAAMKTRADGFFYMPNIIGVSTVKVELWYNGNPGSYMEGDQTGGASPYSTIANWPDGKVDNRDIVLESKTFGLGEGNAGWDYMADVQPDRTINIIDRLIPSQNFGDAIAGYNTDPTNIHIVFQPGGQDVKVDSNGFASVPPFTTSFIVYNGANPVLALVTFWAPPVGVYYNLADSDPANTISNKESLPTVPYNAPTVPPPGSFVIGGPYAYGSPPWFMQAVQPFSVVNGNIVAQNNQCPSTPYYIGTYNGLTFVFGTTAENTLIVASSYPNCPQMGVYYNSGDSDPANTISNKVSQPTIHYTPGTVPPGGSFVIGGWNAYGSPAWFVQPHSIVNGNIVAPNNLCPSTPYYIGTYNGLTFVFGTTAENTQIVASSYPNCPQAGVYYNSLDQPAANTLSGKVSESIIPYNAPTVPPPGSFVIGGPYAYGSPPWFMQAVQPFSVVNGNIVAQNNQCPSTPYYIGTYNGLTFVFGTTTENTLIVASSYPNCPQMGVYYNSGDSDPANTISNKVSQPTIHYTLGTVPPGGSFIIGGWIPYGSPTWFVQPHSIVNGNIVAPNNLCPSTPYYIGTYNGLTFVFGTTAENTIIAANYYPNCPPLVGVYYNSLDQPAANTLSGKVLLPTVSYNSLTVPPPGSFVIGGPYAYGSPPWFMQAVQPFSVVNGNIVAPNNLCPSTPYYIGTYNGLTFVFGTTTENTQIVANTYPICPIPLSVSAIAPASPTIDAGTSITMSETVIEGTPPYSFQWYNDLGCPIGNKIFGATGSTMTLSSASPPSSPFTRQHYSVKVTDASGQNICASDSAIVYPAFKFISLTSLTSNDIMRGNTITVTASWSGGSPNYYINWYYSDVPAMAAGQPCTSYSNLVDLDGSRASYLGVIGTSNSITIAPSNSVDLCVAVGDSANPSPQMVTSSDYYITVHFKTLCYYKYDYTENTVLKNMANTYIPFNEVISGTGYMGSGGDPSRLLKVNAISAVPSSIQMGGSATLKATWSGGTAPYRVDWYLSGSDLNCWKFQSAGPQQPVRSAGNLNTGSDTYITTVAGNYCYVVTDSSSPSNWNEPYYATTVGENNYFNANVLPYFTFAYGLPSLYGMYMTQFYDIFGPMTYYTPSESIDMYPIDTPSNFYVSYNTVLLSEPAEIITDPANFIGAVDNADAYIKNFANLAAKAQPPPANPNPGPSCTAPVDLDTQAQISTKTCYTPAQESGSSLACSVGCTLQANPCYSFVMGSATTNGFVYSCDSPTVAANSIGFTSPYMTNAISIAAMPNDYVYVLNVSPDTIPAGAGQTVERYYHISILRLVPIGYYNTSDYQPSIIAQISNTVASDAEKQWASDWQSYWANVITMQNRDAYVVRTIDLYQLAKEQNAPVVFQNSPEVSFGSLDKSGFTPLNISVDSYADVFISGTVDIKNPAGSMYPDYISPAIVEITNTLTPSSMRLVANIIDLKGLTLPEIAASPTGRLVFMASPDSGSIFSFAGNDFALTGTFNLTYAAGTGSYNYAILNITDYLYRGGLYGVPMDGGTQINGLPNVWTPNVIYSDNNKDSHNDFDTNAFHHPMGLQDINGYLYVLDDWAGNVGWKTECTLGNSWLGCSNNGGVSFGILTIRVINATGKNVPLNPNLFNAMYSTQGCHAPVFSDGSMAEPGKSYPLGTTNPKCEQKQCTLQKDAWYGSGRLLSRLNPKGWTYSCVAKGGGGSTFTSLATGQYGANDIFPPYGWILSANITASKLKDNNDCAGQEGVNGCSVDFCSSPACDAYPNHMPTDYKGNYKPIGPQLSAKHGSISNAAFTVAFDGTVDMLFKMQSKSTGWCFWVFGSCDTWISPTFNTLITTNLNILNYTKLFGGNPPSTCYTDNTLASDRKGGYCSLLNGVKYMGAPVYTVTNPFGFLENLGGSQLLTLEGQFYSSYQQSSQPQGCQSLALTGQPCTASSVYQKGPPSLSIQQGPANWGQSDLITSTADDTKYSVNIIVDGNVVATGTGTAAYSTCADPTNAITCLSTAGSPHEIKAEEFDSNGNNKGTNPYSLDVHNTPLAILGTPTVEISYNALLFGGAQQCTPDAVNVMTAQNGDNVEVSLYDPTGLRVADFPSTSPYTYNLIPANGIVCSNLQAGTYTVNAIDSTQSTQTSQLLYVVSAGPSVQLPTLSNAASLGSGISGYVLVPYEYTYNMMQTWDNLVVTGVSGPGAAISDCKTDNIIPNQPMSGTFTTFTDSLITGNSNVLSAILEGGATYLKNFDTRKLLVVNLSDTDNILPPQIRYTLENNRIFGTLYINDTNCDWSKNPVDCSNNFQTVLNATKQQKYSISAYSQMEPSPHYDYETIINTPLMPLQYGANLISQTNIATVTTNALALTYNTVNYPIDIPLFDLYKEVSYTNPLNLSLNNTQYTSPYTTLYGGMANTLGYHRLIYVMEDMFSDQVYVPIDADIAKPAVIRMTVNTVVDVNNANKTYVTINGIAGMWSDFGTKFEPLPAGQKIYLYYNTNLNYVSYNAVLDPTNAINCAYSINNLVSELSCQQSNPIFTGRQENANLITYNPSFNGVGDCSPPPNGLLENTIQKCNVYSNAGLSAICPDTGAVDFCMQQTGGGAGYQPCIAAHSISGSGGSEQFCVPIFSNGTGWCTPQLGLFDIEPVDANGMFGNTITACGIRNDQIIAEYYGWPPPEPILVTQTPLALSENTVANTAGITMVTSNELNFYYAPNQTVSNLQLGLFELSYGNMGIAAIAAAIAISAALIVILSRRRNR